VCARATVLLLLLLRVLLRLLGRAAAAVKGRAAARELLAVVAVLPHSAILRVQARGGRHMARNSSGSGGGQRARIAAAGPARWCESCRRR
jgi:hypothetical protein